MSADIVALGTDRQGSDQTTSRPGWFKIAQRLHDLPVWAHHALATALVLLTVAAHYSLADDHGDFRFVFFMPAILLTSMVLAHGSGIWAVLLSALLIQALFVPPLFNPWFTESDDILAMVVFVGSGLVTAVMGGMLHSALFRLSAANERIAASEREKELLLHELAHRFRNDLTNLTAILHLQAMSTPDPVARSELMVASERIHVLGRVHQRLTHFTDTTDVEVRDFLTGLCDDLRTTTIGGRPISLDAEIEAARLPYTTAITLGLIANELVQNALKYAFPGDRPGHITVRFCCRGGEFHLAVSDDGVGQAAPGAASSGLGEKLIGSFVKQLRGSWEVHVGAGRTAKIRFPVR